MPNKTLYDMLRALDLLTEEQVILAEQLKAIEEMWERDEAAMEAEYWKS